MWISESLKKINLSPGKVLEICFYKRLSFWWQTNQLRKKFGHFKRHLTLWTTHETCFNMEEPLCRVKAEYNKFAVYLSFIIEEFPFHKPWKKSLLKIPVFNNCHWCKILKCRWRHKKRHPKFFDMPLNCLFWACKQASLFRQFYCNHLCIELSIWNYRKDKYLVTFICKKNFKTQ